MDERRVYDEDTKTAYIYTQAEVIDPETGEIVEVPQVTQQIYGAKRFYKAYLSELMQSLKILKGKQKDVLIHIYENMKYEDNTFIGTYKRIAADTGISEPVIAGAMTTLQKHRFIRRISNGVWQVNPSVLMSGSERKRRYLVLCYEGYNEAQALLEGETE